MFRPEPEPARQGWGLAGGSQSLGAGIAGGLPKLLLELKACLPVGFKQFLEAGMEVVIFLLQVVQTGVDLVQHGVDGSVFCFPEAVFLAFRARLHRRAQVPVGARHCGLGRRKGRAKMERGDGLADSRRGAERQAVPAGL